MATTINVVKIVKRDPHHSAPRGSHYATYALAPDGGVHFIGRAVTEDVNDDAAYAKAVALVNDRVKNARIVDEETFERIVAGECFE